MSGGEGGTGTAEKFFSMKRGGAGGPRTEMDAMSDTSSQQERKFSMLLGGPDPHDMLIRGGPAGGPMNVGKRLYVVGVNRLIDKEERLQNVREQVLMKEMSEMTQRPAITRKARQRSGKGALFADSGREWLENKERHLIDAQERVKAAEVIGMQAQPTLDRKSSTMVERLGDYQGPVTGWETHFAKYCAKKTSTTPRDLFQPTINSNAIRVDIEKEIGQRLYDDSVIREQRREQLEREVHEKELVDPNTGRQLFSPQPLDCNPNRELRSPNRLTEELLEGGRRIEEKKKEVANKIRNNDPNLTFSPTINKRSGVIAQKVQRSPLHQPRRRLSPGATPDTSAVASPASPSDANGSASKVKQQAHIDPNEFLRRTELSEHLRQQKLLELQRSVDAEQGRECSFQPRINRRSFEIWEKQTSQYGGGGGGGNVVDGVASKSAAVASAPPAAFRQPQFAHSSLGSTSHSMARLEHPVSPGTSGPGIMNASSVSFRHSAISSSPPPSTTTQYQTSPLDLYNDRQPQRSNLQSPPKVETYINSFEQQMFQVLDEWRRIEDPSNAV